MVISPLGSQISAFLLEEHTDSLQAFRTRLGKSSSEALTQCLKDPKQRPFTGSRSNSNIVLRPVFSGTGDPVFAPADSECSVDCRFDALRNSGIPMLTQSSTSSCRQSP